MHGAASEPDDVAFAVQDGAAMVFFSVAGDLPFFSLFLDLSSIRRVLAELGLLGRSRPPPCALLLLRLLLACPARPPYFVFSLALALFSPSLLRVVFLCVVCFWFSSVSCLASGASNGFSVCFLPDLLSLSFGFSVSCFSSVFVSPFLLSSFALFSVISSLAFLAFVVFACLLCVLFCFLE